MPLFVEMEGTPDIRVHLFINGYKFGVYSMLSILLKSDDHSLIDSQLRTLVLRPNSPFPKASLTTRDPIQLHWSIRTRTTGVGVFQSYL